MSLEQPCSVGAMNKVLHLFYSVTVMVLSKCPFQDLYPRWAGMCLEPSWELFWWGGGFPSGFSFLVIGSHQASKLCLVGSPDWNSHPCLCGLPLPLQASCSHRFPPSLLQMSRVWNSSHPLSFIQARLLSFGLKSWMTTLPVEAKMTSHGVRGPSWTEADCWGVPFVSMSCTQLCRHSHAFVSLACLCAIRVLPGAHWFGRHVSPSTMD